MDVLLIVAGVLFLTWPLQYRRSMRRIRQRLRERRGDVGRFDRTMDRWWISAMLVVAPVLGVVVIVLGVTD